MRARGTEVVSFLKEVLGKKDTRLIKKIQARCEGYSFWRQKKEQAGERGNKLSPKRNK